MKRAFISFDADYDRRFACSPLWPSLVRGQPIGISDWSGTQKTPHTNSQTPSHDDAKMAVFKDLQKYESVGLIVPIGEEHMYFTATNLKKGL